MHPATAQMSRSSIGTQLRQLTEPLLASKEGSSPHEDAAAFRATRSDILFSWVRPVLQRASRSRSQPCSAHSMSIDDLSSLPAGNGVHWADEQLQSRRRRYPTEPLARSLCCAFWRPMAHAGLLKLAADLLRYLPPLLLSILLRRLGSATPEPPGSVAALVTYAIAFALPVVTLLTLTLTLALTPTLTLTLTLPLTLPLTLTLTLALTLTGR